MHISPHIPPKINQDVSVNFCQSLYAHIPSHTSQNQPRCFSQFQSIFLSTYPLTPHIGLSLPKSTKMFQSISVSFSMHISHSYIIPRKINQDVSVNLSMHISPSYIPPKINKDVQSISFNRSIHISPHIYLPKSTKMFQSISVHPPLKNTDKLLFSRIWYY